MDTPIIYQGEESSQSSKKTIEINDGSIFKLSACTVFLSIVFILSIIAIPNLLGKILCPVIIVIVYIISLYLIEKKIVIMKDSLNKKIIVKVINYLCRAKTTLSFDPENLHFSRELTKILNVIDTYKNNRSTFLYFTFYIINDHKNLFDIDLNESNIRQKPAKCIYTFRRAYFGYETETENYIDKLNEFCDTSHNCTLFSFNINSYLADKNINVGNTKKYQYFSEHFFSYEVFFEEKQDFCSQKLTPCQSCLLAICTLVMVFAFIISVGIVMAIINGIYIWPLIALAIEIGIFLFLYFIYKCPKYSLGNIKRIDFIFSKNFNTMFIGLVKISETKYLNTFEFQINNFNKFFYETDGANNNNFKLKVQFKNDETQQICILKKQTQNELEGLISFLNGEFMKHSYIQNNSDF